MAEARTHPRTSAVRKGDPRPLSEMSSKPMTRGKILVTRVSTLFEATTVNQVFGMIAEWWNADSAAAGGGTMSEELSWVVDGHRFVLTITPDREAGG